MKLGCQGGDSDSYFLLYTHLGCSKYLYQSEATSIIYILCKLFYKKYLSCQNLFPQVPLSSLISNQCNNNERFLKKSERSIQVFLFHSIFLAPEQYVEPHVINKVFFGCPESVFPQHIRRADHLPGSGQRRGRFGRTCLS